MDRKKILIMIACSGILTACSTQNFTEPSLHSNSEIQRDTSKVKVKVADLKPNSPLLAPVDKSIQDSVIKRIKMDLNPDVEHYRNTYQRVRDDIPPLDFSSLEFAPVITRPRSWITYEGDEPLWINKEFAYIYGKTESGEDVYIEARYKDRRDAVNSPSYKARLKAEGKEKADILLKNLLNRSGIDHWDIVVVYSQGGIMPRYMDYARSQSDDGKFFILKQGQHHSEICYFKDGKPVSCRGGSRGGEIVVRDFTSLMR